MTIHFNEVWTKPRVDRLTELWADGWSASGIASDLGGGISRSGVLSKIHRLNLPDPVGKRIPKRGAERLTRQNPNPVPRAENKPLNRAFVAPPPVTSEGRIQNVTRLQAKTNGHDPAQRRNPSHNILAKIAIAEAEPGIPERLKGEAPDGTGIKLIDLDSSTCRWPRGMPGDPDFEFCGGYALKDMPYCAHHTRMAYVPTPARRPTSPAY